MMIRRLKFFVKQMLKMLLQNVILPCVYYFWRCVYASNEPELIIFADAHHKQMPFSMVRIHQALEDKGYRIIDYFFDFSHLGVLRSAMVSVRFMRIYAQAKCVFICDTFLPVASCRKDPRTIVVQLLHSCGLLKKMGYDTTEDIPAGYIGHVYKNYSLVTVSAPCCVQPLRKAMRLSEGIVQPLGVSRTDCYFDPEWLECCRERFYVRYPEAVDKKVIVWAPTFRGNAGDPYQVGLDAICRLEENLGGDCFLIKKVHPHVEEKYHLSTCDIPTEELLVVTDLLISDYSSVVNEFMLFERPYVLYAQDLETYEKIRGFYVPYQSLTPYIATDADQLEKCVRSALEDKGAIWVRHLREYHLAACDGKATERIVQCLNL